MTAKSTAIRPAPAVLRLVPKVQQKPAPNAELVSCLNEVLGQALNGELDGAILILKSPHDGWGNILAPGSAMGDLVGCIGALQRASHVFSRRIDDGWEEE